METFEVYMLAFMRGKKIRKVQVPSGELLEGEENIDGNLDRIFYYGQNDFQPQQDCSSVSVGDVIKYDDSYYMVNDFGFVKIGHSAFLTLSMAIQRS